MSLVMPLSPQIPSPILRKYLVVDRDNEEGDEEGIFRVLKESLIIDYY